MAEQEINSEKSFKIFLVSKDFLLENPNTDDLIKVIMENQSLGKNGVLEAPNLVKGLMGYPLVTTSGLGLYGSAQYVSELDLAVPHLNSAFLALFTLCAQFKTLYSISFMVDLNNTLSVLIETPEKEIYAWRSVSSDRIFVSEKVREVPLENVITINISELMYAFSVSAEHIRMGSNCFRITTYQETNDFTVSFYDYEKEDIRMDIAFPLMPREATPVIH